MYNIQRVTFPIVRKTGSKRGFTLAELSIVLVVIGLIVGGILTARDLIGAAETQATVTQIANYNAAANTFRERFNALPGDIPADPAAQFGFAARGTSPGEGDGNGIIDGIDSIYINNSEDQGGGENAMFWVDLSKAKLIDGGFSTATSTTLPYPLSSSTLPLYLPPAKLGKGNYIYVWSGGYGYLAHVNPGDSNNYFGISNISSTDSSGHVYATPGLTVGQAYSIDKKIDDGLPQSGRVLALYSNYPIHSSTDPIWAGGPSVAGASGTGNAPTTAATSGSSTTCYDNGGVAGTQNYSMTTNNGKGVNCALSFRFE